MRAFKFFPFLIFIFFGIESINAGTKSGPGSDPCKGLLEQNLGPSSRKNKLNSGSELTLRAGTPYQPSDGEQFDFSNFFKKRPTAKRNPLVQTPTQATQTVGNGISFVPAVHRIMTSLSTIFELTKNGKHMIYSSPRSSGGSDIHVVEVGGGWNSVLQVHFPHDVIKVTHSPNGSRIAFISLGGEVAIVDSLHWNLLSRFNLGAAANGKGLNTLSADEAFITGDNQNFIFASSSATPALDIIDLSTGRLKRQSPAQYYLHGASAPSIPLYHGAVASPDGRLLFKLVKTPTSNPAAPQELELLVEEIKSGHVLNSRSINLGTPNAQKILADTNQKFLIIAGLKRGSQQIPELLVLEWNTWRELHRIALNGIDQLRFIKILDQMHEGRGQSVVVTGDQVSLVYDTKNWNLKATLVHSNNRSMKVHFAKFVAEQSLYVVTDSQGEAQFYDTSTWNRLFQMPSLFRGYGDDIETDRFGSLIFNRTNYYEIVVTDRASLWPLAVIGSRQKDQFSTVFTHQNVPPPNQLSPINTFFITPDGRYLITKTSWRRIEAIEIKP